jgi:hypothetical protein
MVREESARPDERPLQRNEGRLMPAIVIAFAGALMIGVTAFASL